MGGHSELRLPQRDHFHAVPCCGILFTGNSMITLYCWPPRINVVDSSSISRMRITLNMCRALTHGVMVVRIECMVYVRPMSGKVKDIRHHRHVLYIPSNPNPRHLLGLIPKRLTATTISKIEGALYARRIPCQREHLSPTSTTLKGRDFAQLRCRHVLRP